ncbi:MAG TPA: tRNA (guanosine(37)-N1)-methyltransferase TrmD [Polyangia bacterium]|jgi:tRNA (guanine37-N1)-methyltransferase
MSDAAPLVTFELVTLFPELFAGILTTSLLGKAIAAGLLAVHATSPRDFGKGRHRSVDDTPYGGGPGMILGVEPVAAALQAITEARGPSHRVLLSPQGAVFDQRRAEALSRRSRITLICGRYEGFDERVGQALCDEQMSIGDYVLAGGELAAAVIIEAVARLVPGVLGCGMSANDESFSRGRLEYPQWTRPEAWQGLAVPPVMLSGDHQAIARFRLREAARRTRDRRPDLLAAWPLTAEERRALDEEPGGTGPGEGQGGAKSRPGP